VRTTYDAAGQAYQISTPDATPANDTDCPNEQYVFDSGGRRTSMVTRAGQTLSYSYDNLDQLTGRTGPTLNARTYVYDLGGRRTQVKDMNGAAVIAQTDFAYDTAGRETRERRNDPPPLKLRRDKLESER
jgi:YD repeat-containing protein